ncbi:MAG: hypothetical protein P8Z80_09715 [Pseudolabrys sp.]|jgi:hypothetical protein
MVGISAAASLRYISQGTASSKSDWLSSAQAAIKASQNQAGIMGALTSLSRTGGRGSIGSFLSSSKTFAGNFATIAQSSVTSYGSYYAQLANQNQQKAAKAALKKALQALSASQNKVKPKNTLPSFMYLGNGQTLDTDKGILTRQDGTQIDITTGAEVVNPADIVQMGNGSYLNTATNIMTLSDGTKVDTVTGLKVDTSA